MNKKVQHLLWAVGLAWHCLHPAYCYSQTIASIAVPSAQTRLPQGTSMLLREALMQLREKYNVDVMFEEKLLKEIYVGSDLIRPERKIEENLKNLLKKTGLRFKKVDAETYLILAPKGEPSAGPKTISTSGLPAEGESRSNEPAGLDSPQSPLPSAVTISGRVTDEKGGGIPGVNVLLKGTTTGTTTNSDGNYSLNAPDGNGTLIFSYIGYVTEEVAINGQTRIDAALVPDVKSLSEVVVVGYGTQSKKEVVGSIGVATAKDFGDIAVSSTSQLMQGKISGVQVVNNNGLPGSGTSVIVRGTGSFTNISPLYVIDGIQSGEGTFNSLSPYDIQEITVLKDASSIAIYGAKGANGVVIVTTKKAKTGTPRVTYNGYYGISQAWKQLDLLNAPQYIELVNEMQNGRVPEKLNSPEVLVDRTDWQDEMFRTAKLTEHHVGIAGGSEKVLYNVSAGFTDQESIVVGYKFQRFNIRLNLEEKLGKRFRFGQQLNLQYSIKNGHTPDLVGGIRMPPYAPVYDETNRGGFSKVTSINDLNDAFNPLTEVYLREKRDRRLSNYGQFFGEVDLIKGLTFRTQASINFTTSNDYNYVQANQNGNLNNPNGITEGTSWSFSPLIENFFTYNREFGIHALTLTAGNTYIASGLSRSQKFTGSDFVNDEIKQVGAAPKAVLTEARANSGTSLISYFGRVNYTLMDKYIVSASFRRDGSSVFGPDNRWGNFPSVGVAWRLSEEAFLKNVTFVSDLKLRASWGKTGNANIGNFLYETYVFRGNANNLVYSLGPNKDYALGATINRAANPNIKWEETTQTDIGLDVGLLNNRIGLSIDWYNRQNDDLLVEVGIPPTTGLGGTASVPTSVIDNAASGYNRGIEVTASYNGNVRGFTYSISANGAYNHNEVTSLGGINVAPITGGRFAGLTFTRTEPGQPIGAFYGYKVDHVAVDQADVNRYNELARAATGNPNAVYQSKLLPGDIIFQDLNQDGQVTEKDRTFLGSPIPKYTYGANVNLGYKNFDLMLSLQGVAGVELVNALKYWTEGMTRPFNSSTAVLNRWRQEGDVTNIPKAGQNATGNDNLRPSDRYIERGDFMRIRNLTLGYSLPAPLLNQLTAKVLSSARFYLTAQNLFTFTKYSGYDPEVSAVDPNNDSHLLFSRGVDVGQYPQARTFMVGVQLGL